MVVENSLMYVAASKLSSKYGAIYQFICLKRRKEKEGESWGFIHICGNWKETQPCEWKGLCSHTGER